MPVDQTANSTTPVPAPSLAEKTRQYLAKKRGAASANTSTTISDSAPATTVAATSAASTPVTSTATAAVTPTTEAATESEEANTAPKVDGEETEPAAAVPAVPPANTSTPVSVRGMTNVVDALSAKGLIDQETLKAVKFEALTTNQQPLKILQAKGLIDSGKVQQVKAEMYGIGYIDLSSISIQPDVLAKLSKDIALRNMAVVFEETNARCKVAMEEPLDLQRVKYIESLVGKKVDTYYATPEAIRQVIETRYGAQIGGEVNRALEDIGVVDINADLQSQNLDNSSIEGAPVAKIVNMILDYAIKHDASDIHIEPRETRVAVRFRIHGILSEKLTLPSELANSIVARIKILSNMRIDEHRVPQDNRFQVKSNGSSVDIRVSVMPSIYGEKVVMRILEKDQGVLPMAELGMRGPSMQAYKASIAKTQGIILITGPVGSGKTVTLASTLSVLNTQEVNIITLEDPVEVRINGITQVQVNPDVGLTFASGLRAFLRQDPDVIMVGEIRDSETASLAVQAALVGRLVLATLHTNSAAGALPRLLDLGVQPYLLASTINAVCAQRLVRKVCDECKQPYKASAEVVQMMHKELDSLHGFDLKGKDGETVHFDSKTKDITLYKPVGCPQCGGEGYQGRIGIFEVMTVSEKIGRMLMQTNSARDIHEQAVAEGMITMVQDGFMKALEGITTVEEVLRVQTI